MKIGDYVSTEKYELECGKIVGTYLSKNDLEGKGFIINPLAGLGDFPDQTRKFRKDLLTLTTAPILDSVLNLIRRNS